MDGVRESCTADQVGSTSGERQRRPGLRGRDLATSGVDEAGRGPSGLSQPSRQQPQRGAARSRLLDPLGLLLEGVVAGGLIGCSFRDLDRSFESEELGIRRRDAGQSDGLLEGREGLGLTDAITDGLGLSDPILAHDTSADRNEMPIAVRALGRATVGESNEAVLGGLDDDFGLVCGARVDEAAREVQGLFTFQHGAPDAPTWRRS